MKLQTIKNVANKGFTLIELLVVITIIGILATGATTTYTSQISKARDTVRVSDIKAMQGGVEQVYQDEMEYPDTGDAAAALMSYVDKIPVDPKDEQGCNIQSVAAEGTHSNIFGYSYNVRADLNGIANALYEMSTSFEAKGNVINKAAKDSGDDDNRLEIGIFASGATISTNVFKTDAGVVTIGTAAAPGVLLQP